MSKRRIIKGNAAQPKPQPSWRLWFAGAVVVMLAVIGLSMWLILGETGQESGTPKLAVYQTVIDEGYQTLDTVVRTSFTLRNEGDGPLRILGEPQVRLVEGC